MNVINCTDQVFELPFLSFGTVLCKVQPFRSDYGRVFPSKTLRNVPAFARAYARAKVKGGGVIPESGCEVGVAWA